MDQRMEECFNEWRDIDSSLVDSLLGAKSEQLVKIASNVRNDDKATKIWKSLFSGLNYKDFNELFTEQLVFYILQLEDNLLLKGSSIWTIGKVNNINNLCK